MPSGRCTMWMTWLCALLLSAANVEAQAKTDARGAATVDDKEARDLFRLGKQAFDEGRYERALKYFKDAYDLSGRAALQFNIGTVLDRLRRDREAIDAYRSYLTQTPDAPNRAAVEERVGLLEAALGKGEPPSVAPEPLAPSAPPTAATPPAESAPPSVPTPEETARAAVASDAAPARPAPHEPAAESSSIASRWWFWTGLGAVVAGAVVVGVALGSSSSKTLEAPAVLGASTRVRSL